MIKAQARPVIIPRKHPIVAIGHAAVIFAPNYSHLRVHAAIDWPRSRMLLILTEWFV